MLNISDSDKSIWKQDSVHKELTISIPDKDISLTNDDLTIDGIELTESIETESNLSFTGCIASTLKFKCVNLSTDIRGQYITVSIKPDNADTVQIFSGYVDEQTNKTFEDVTSEIKAYDVLYTVLNKDVTTWYNSLTFPITVKNFRNGLFTQLGIEQETVTLINDRLNVNKAIYDSTISAGTLLRGICQLNARFGQIGRDGKFHYRKLNLITEGLYPSETLYPSNTIYPSDETISAIVDKAYYTSVNYEPYKTEFISKVNIYDSEGICEGTYGTGTNVFAISDNPIAYSVNMSTAAKNIYEEICNIQYTPAKIDLIGLPYIECGDSLLAATNKYIVRTYVLSRTLSGVQALKDSVDSDSDQMMGAYTESANTKITKNEKTTLSIQADIVEMNTLIADRATIAQLNATNAEIANIKANYVTTAKLTADEVTINGSISAVSGRVEKIESNYVTVGTLNANVANINGSISAVSGRVETIESNYVTTKTLEANYVTTTTLNAKNFTANHITAGTINGNYVSWQVISCIGSGSWGYLYKNSSTKDIIFSTSSTTPNPAYTKLCGFINGINSKNFYTIAKDNA